MTIRSKQIIKNASSSWLKDLKEKHQIDCCLGRAHIVMNAAARLASAAVAFKPVIVQKHITETGFEFKIPMLGQHERKAVRYSCTIGIALVSVVPENGEVRPQKGDVIVYAAEIEGSADKMSAYKMTRESVTKPVTGLRLRHPMFPFDMTVLAPCIEIAGKIKSPFGSQSDFHSEIDSRCRIVKKISL